MRSTGPRACAAGCHLDERAAGYFALGLARQLREPVAIVTTSGTAAANLHPAIAEASLSRVPLIALTADRPPELRDTGANQTIEQHGLYGRHARWFAELPVPDGSPGLEAHAQRSAARAVAVAAGPPGRPGAAQRPAARAADRAGLGGRPLGLERAAGRRLRAANA